MFLNKCKTVWSIIVIRMPIDINKIKPDFMVVSGYKWCLGPYSLGLAYIDVSSYPQEMQRSYKIFASRCSRCHTLARPINSDFSADKWQKYVYRMMNKSGSGLTKEISDEIIRFLIYDHQIRKI